MPHALTRLQIEGLRTVDRADLDLGTGLTVLIGENGTGKSTILEALEILRRAADHNFIQTFNGVHGGLFRLLRHGAKVIHLAVEGQQAGKASGYRYELSLHATGDAGAIGLEEKLTGFYGDFHRRLGQQQISHVNGAIPFLSSLETALSSAGPFERVREAIASTELHLPFESTPEWAARAHDRKAAMRGSAVLFPASRLERFGANLANVYATLRNEKDWDETLEYVRLGLGSEVEGVSLHADPGGGAVALSVRFGGNEVRSSALSDGQLCYLAFVGLFRLHARSPASVLAFDEPDLHLHPRLLQRVVGFLEAMGRTAPVVIATHSDRLLDLLADPASSVVVCDLDAKHATRLRRPDRARLAEWLDDYTGLGAVRSAGYLQAVVGE